ncbi:Histone-lysine N-methyltransferase 2A [Coemansia sp. RSA 1199]|nr:Histone-lysine N-methyltransferase 2A [Coemansia sp. RSA 1199]
MVGERHKERSRGGRSVHSASTGKISIGNLVKEGLLTAGNVVVCNAWPFSAVVTSTGTFDAQWSPLPQTFISGVGTEFMRSEFETPSAWATAVCRVMRAQTQAQKAKGELSDKHVRGKGTNGESRVAVNGWTACRVRVSRRDENWDIVERLDSDVKKESDVVEVPLDVLRREMTNRVSKRTVRRPGWRKSRQSLDVQRDEQHMDLDSRNSGTDDEPEPATRRNSAELQEISGAVDGLARRVESDLALGCVKQRRAAAAAANAISASVHPLVTSPSKPTINGTLTETRRHIHSRKRKSIPDMSRHAKQSRVPSDSSDSASDLCVGMDAGTRSQLAYFRERADALKRTHSELKALRYQRKQQLKRRIANALDLWLHQRAEHRVQRRTRVSSQMQPVSPMPSAAASPVVATMSDGAIPVGVGNVECVARVCVPESQLKMGLPQLCTACGSAGNVDACRGCGDLYHDGCGWDCRDTLAFVSQWRVCPTCRVCAQCLDRNSEGDLLQCDECGIHMHSLCSAQTAAHSDGLAGAVREAGGRWVCDSCVCCAECGFTMPDRSNPDHDESPSPDVQRTRWTHDFSMCGTCAAHIDRGRVCPECVATYANCHIRDTSMVCCDVCQFWVHATCDPSLEPQVYDALITLEDEAYVCPRCCAARNCGVLESSSRDASDTESDGAGPWLPRCLRLLDVAKPEHVCVSQEPQMAVACESPNSAKSEPEMIEEAANLLLSLTHSDVRFGYHRFNVDALEQRFCTRKLRTRRGYVDDWRLCALCGLRGDGTQMLGRLVPMYAAESVSTKQWVHVECVAWAWGPRPVRINRVQTDGRVQIDGRVQQGVRFEGALLDGSPDSTGASALHLPTCTLCTRSNASFHCCAPVPCYDTAFHLPCLLLDGTLSPCLAPDRAQYCAAWRRALCASHAPMFAAMMPADGAIKSPSYDHECVQVRVDNTGLASAKCEDRVVDVVGGLVVFEWGEYSDDPAPGLRCLRVFAANDVSYAIGVETYAEHTSVVWHGWIGKVPNDLMARVNHSTRASSLSELLALLFAQMPEIAASSPLASVLVKTSTADALRFIGLPSIIP